MKVKNGGTAQVLYHRRDAAANFLSPYFVGQEEKSIEVSLTHHHFFSCTLEIGIQYSQLLLCPQYYEAILRVLDSAHYLENYNYFLV